MPCLGAGSHVDGWKTFEKLTKLASRRLHLVKGSLHGLCCGGQLLKGFRTDGRPPCTGGNLALQGGNPSLQGPQLSPTLRLESLQAMHKLHSGSFGPPAQNGKPQTVVHQGFGVSESCQTPCHVSAHTHGNVAKSGATIARAHDDRYVLIHK